MALGGKLALEVFHELVDRVYLSEEHLTYDCVYNFVEVFSLHFKGFLFYGLLH